jgi:hypothetical protein
VVAAGPKRRSIVALFLGVGAAEIILLLFVVIPLAAAVSFWLPLRRRARQFGYPSTRAYLRAAPRSDPERRDAVDLTLKGIVFCLLGLIFPPFILVGLVPLFFGGRKLVYGSMGFGLVDDADPPDA